MADLPRFDNSAMDGYAVRAADVSQASAANPVRLRVLQQLPAKAYAPLPQLAPGTAARIFTGAPIPPAADAVVAQERTTLQGEHVEISLSHAVGRNIRFRGEELRLGNGVAKAGQRISPGLLAALINAGISEVEVHPAPRISVITSGDELKPIGAPLLPGEIPDSNAPLISAMLKSWGYDEPSSAHVGDDPALVLDALARALDVSDLVITTGGASVGEKDFLPASAERLGVQRVFWKVAQKPGKPMFFGVREDGKVVLALPGNPGAVLIGMALHARAVLDHLEGASAPGPHWFMGRLSEGATLDAHRVCLQRMTLDFTADGGAVLRPLPNQGSHMLSNLALASVLAWFPAGAVPLVAGAPVKWTWLPV